MKKKETNKKLRIAVIVRNFSETGGGAERYCFETTKRLSEFFDIEVFSQTIENTIDNIKFHKVSKFLQRPRFLNQLFFSFSVYRKLKNKSFDLVHSHDTLPFADIQTFHVKPVKQKSEGLNSLISYFYTKISIKKQVYLSLEKRSLSNEKSLIFVSKYLRNKFESLYELNNSNIHIVYPGVSISKNINHIRSIGKKLKILFIAHGFARKGLQNIVYALEDIRNEDISLYVAGNGDRGKIKFLSELVKNNTYFLGGVKDIEDFYFSGDLLIHPTKDDTFGMVVLEAMSYMKPVIVSSAEYCGISELLTSNEAYIISNPFNYIEIKEAILNFIRSPKERIKISKNGFAMAQRLSWEKSTNEIIEIYKSHLTLNKK